MDKTEAINNNSKYLDLTNKQLGLTKISDNLKSYKDDYKIDPKVYSLVNDKESLKNKAIYEVKNLIWNKNINKHTTSSTREWGNSVYLYNKNYVKTLPLAASRLDNILTSYFNINFFNQGRKSKSTDILERKYTLNKTLVSKSEVKVTSDKVNLTVYIYNRNKETLLRQYNSNNSKFSLANKNNLNKILKHYTKFITNVKDHKENIIKALMKSRDKKENLELKKLDSKLGTKIMMKFFVDYLNQIYLKKMLKVYYIRHLVINNSKFKNWFMLGLKKTLTKLYNKKVELNIVNQKYYYLNSDIFTKAIATRLRDRNNRVAYVIKNALANVSLANLRHHSYNYFSLKNNNSSLKTINKVVKLNVFNGIKYKNIKGIRIEAAGRLTQRLTAARSLFKVASKGNLKANENLSFSLIRGNAKPNVQYTNLNAKTRNGAFGLKGWVNSN